MPALLNALTQGDLDEKCEDGDAVRLHPICHPHAGLSVVYTAHDGLLHVACAQCGEPLVHIEVAV